MAMIAVWWVAFTAHGQDTFFTKAYAENIGIIRCNTVGLDLTLPILSLQGNDQVLLSFDDMDGDSKDYYYTLQLCNHDWTPSELPPFQYIDGFESGPIPNFNYSSNTLLPYTNYQLLVPNRDMRLTKAGNYIIKVYLDDDPSQLVLTQRIYMVDPKVQVNGSVIPSNSIRFRKTHQEVDFVVNHQGYPISNAFQSIEATVMQNGREDNAVMGLKPNFVRDQKLIYDYEEENLFPAMKEFRWVNLQSLIMLDERIKLLEMFQGVNHAYVAPDPIRSYDQYVYRRDINGRFIINDQDDYDPAINGDYVLTHFTLPFNNELPSGKLYVMGGFNQWQRTEANELTYNAKRSAYELVYPLKQGYYNYLYAFEEYPGAPLDFELIEGNYFETENDYTILIYHRPFGQLYDALIGVKTVNTLVN